MDGRVKINQRGKGGGGGGGKKPSNKKTIVNRDNNDAGGDRKKIFTGKNSGGGGRSYDRRNDDDIRRFDGESSSLVQREYTSQQVKQQVASTSGGQGDDSSFKLGEMKRSARIVDPYLQWREPSPAADFLLDNNDFLVVGIIGQQGAGKSSLMSLLGGNSWRDKRFHFRPQGFEAKEKGVHMTNGVEMFITAERLILLDTQPVMSLSILDEMVAHDRERRPGTGGGAPDLVSGAALHNVQSIQLCSWLLSVCHVVLVLHDQAPDLALLKLIQTAEMLKPATAAPDGTDNTDYAPQVVSVINRATRDLYQPSNYQACELVIQALTKYSKLTLKGHFGTWRRQLMQELPKDEKPLNLFLIPSANDRCRNPAYPSFELTMRTLRNLILSYPRNANQAHNHEKNWFANAAKAWELVKKSQMMSEYARHLG